MTSFAFILGVAPLVIATGAGAGARRALGTAVLSGMVAATILAVFVVPVLYVVVNRIASRRRAGAKAPTNAEPVHAGGD
jgi:multidrug efflux pump subunit AcrB